MTNVLFCGEKFLSGFTHHAARRHPRLSFVWRSFALFVRMVCLLCWVWVVTHWWRQTMWTNKPCWCDHHLLASQVCFCQITERIKGHGCPDDQGNIRIWDELLSFWCFQARGHEAGRAEAADVWRPRRREDQHLLPVLPDAHLLHVQSLRETQGLRCGSAGQHLLQEEGTRTYRKVPASSLISSLSATLGWWTLGGAVLHSWASAASVFLHPRLFFPMMEAASRLGRAAVQSCFFWEQQKFVERSEKLPEEFSTSSDSRKLLAFTYSIFKYLSLPHHLCWKKKRKKTRADRCDLVHSLHTYEKNYLLF